MTKKPRPLDLDNPMDRNELTSEFLRREGDVILGDLRVAGGRIISTDRGARWESDRKGMRFYDTSGAVIFNFDAATGTLTVSGGIVAGGTITGAVITGGTLQTASSGKRVVIANPPGDRIDFYSGDADETDEGYILVNTSGAAGGRAGVATWTTPQINSKGRPSVSMTGESKDGTTSETVIALSADTILGVATTGGVDTSLQWQGDVALFDSVSDPPTGAASYVRLFNSGGQSLRAISSSVTAPLWPVRAYSVTATPDTVCGTAVADVAGATQTFTTYAPNALAYVFTVADIEITTAGTGFCNVYTHCSGGGTTDFACAVEDRVHRGWHPGSTFYTLATAGSYTIKLRTNKNAAGGAAAVKATNTRMTLLVIG